jgi:hypothetical protein
MILPFTTNRSRHRAENLQRRGRRMGNESQRRTPGVDRQDKIHLRRPRSDITNVQQRTLVDIAVFPKFLPRMPFNVVQISVAVFRCVFCVLL